MPPVAKPAARSALAATGLAPRGLERTQAAAYIGVSARLFDRMVEDGRMPQARRIDARLVWDVRELDQHFDDLPHAKPGPSMGAPEFRT